jgi:glycosyltransferase involved in cell wall biosynthesis
VSGNGRHLGYVLKRFPRISETFIASELLELERQGERVSVFAISRPDEPFVHGFVTQLGAPVVYLPYRPLRQPVRVVRAVARAMRTHPLRWLRVALPRMVLLRPKGWRKILQATVLLNEMGQVGVDHAHAHVATSAARLANLAWRMGGPSYSVTTHAKDIWHADVGVERLRDRLSGARFIATVTEANRRRLEAILTEPERVQVVPNAVDVHRLAPRPASPRRSRTILCVARLVEKKGIGDLVEACAHLVRTDRPVRLEVVGDGPQRPTLEAAATRLGVSATFHGALSHENVLARYREASIFCLPCVVAPTGDRDGLPTAVLEAMALGVPVVSTAVNGLADAVVHQETGLVVPEHAPQALADALARILDDPELAAELVARARRSVEERFTLEASVSLLRSLFPVPT